MKRSEIFDEIERMFRSYRLWQLRLAALQPRLVSRQGIPSAPRKGAPRRPVENLAIERADLAAKIQTVRIVLLAMTRDEQRFVELRYFNEFSMKTVWQEMKGWSQRQLYRLRLSVLVKAAWILQDGSETFLGQKRS